MDACYRFQGCQIDRLLNYVRLGQDDPLGLLGHSFLGTKVQLPNAQHETI